MRASFGEKTVHLLRLPELALPSKERLAALSRLLYEERHALLCRKLPFAEQLTSDPEFTLVPIGAWGFPLGLAVSATVRG